MVETLGAFLCHSSSSVQIFSILQCAFLQPTFSNVSSFPFFVLTCSFSRLLHPATTFLLLGRLAHCQIDCTSPRFTLLSKLGCSNSGTYWMDDLVGELPTLSWSRWVLQTPDFEDRWSSVSSKTRQVGLMLATLHLLVPTTLQPAKLHTNYFSDMSIIDTMGFLFVSQTGPDLTSQHDPSQCFKLHSWNHPHYDWKPLVLFWVNMRWRLLHKIFKLLDRLGVRPNYVVHTFSFLF